MQSSFLSLPRPDTLAKFENDDHGGRCPLEGAAVCPDAAEGAALCPDAAAANPKCLLATRRSECASVCSLSRCGCGLLWTLQAMVLLPFLPRLSPASMRYRSWRTRSVRGALTVRSKCAGGGGGCARPRCRGARLQTEAMCARACAATAWLQRRKVDLCGELISARILNPL